MIEYDDLLKSVQEIEALLKKGDLEEICNGIIAIRTALKALEDDIKITGGARICEECYSTPQIILTDGDKKYAGFCPGCDTASESVSTPAKARQAWNQMQIAAAEERAKKKD